MFIFEINMSEEDLLEEIIPSVLYAMKWPFQEEDALNLGIAQLQDPEFLTDIFTKNSKKLDYYKYSITEAVARTHREANEILQKLYQWQQNVQQGRTPDLDQYFSPLHREAGFLHPGFHTDYQAKGHPKEAPWVRIYAVRCEENLYIITGFGIKLVKQIQEDELLSEELEKLEKARHYLESIGML